jgi:hypothetical protein
MARYPHDGRLGLSATIARRGILGSMYIRQSDRYLSEPWPRIWAGWRMRGGRVFRNSCRGGVALDLILGMGIVLVGAFFLYEAGFTFHTILHGAERFFGV